MTTKKQNENLLRKLKTTAARGTAGKAPAKKAISRKKGGAAKNTPSPKPQKQKGKGNMGATVSIYLHNSDQDAIREMRGRLLTAQNTEANRTHVIRAGLKALRGMAPGAIAQLIEEVKSEDGRLKE